jgi:4-hydroxy-tetrahydrodipicolinate synthase
MPARLDIRQLDTVQLVTPTPFTDDGRQIVPERLAEHSRKMVEAGIRVFLPAAGTGEFHSLSVEEVLECVQVTREAVGSGSIVIAPIGLGVNHATSIAAQAAAAGADAMLLMPLIHPYLCDEGFSDYVLALAGASPLPLLAYKRGPVPSDALLLELARGGQLLGVKYATNDLDAFNRFAQSAPAELGLFCGSAERFAPFFALIGATGFTSGAANICPQLSLELHRLLSSRTFDEAMRIVELVRPIEDFRAREDDSLNISAIKYALTMLGCNFGPPRPPQRRLTSEEQNSLRLIVEQITGGQRSK